MFQPGAAEWSRQTVGLGELRFRWVSVRERDDGRFPESASFLLPETLVLFSMLVEFSLVPSWSLCPLCISLPCSPPSPLQASAILLHFLSCPLLQLLILRKSSPQASSTRRTGTSTSEGLSNSDFLYLTKIPTCMPTSGLFFLECRLIEVRGSSLSTHQQMWPKAYSLLGPL